jgi:hypothetical protein
LRRLSINFCDPAWFAQPLHLHFDEHKTPAWKHYKSRQNIENVSETLIMKVMVKIRNNNKTETYLAILFQTFGSLAATSHIVPSTTRRHFLGADENVEPWLEGIWILGSSFLDCLVPHFLVFRDIVTIITVASLAKEFR